MKLLRKPIVVVALAVVGLALVFLNVAWPILSRAVRRSRAHARTAVATPTPKRKALEAATAAIRKIAPNLPLSRANTPPAVPLDWNAVQVNAPHWVQAPKRDPFLSGNGARGGAAQLLKLQGVWRQDDSNLATINNKVVAAGDSILEFSVEKIETDHVWVLGPNGREPLGFSIPAPAPQLALESEAKP